MKKKLFIATMLIGGFASLAAQKTSVVSPDSNLKVDIFLEDNKPVYSVTYLVNTILESSPLGVVTNVCDLSKNMKWVNVKNSTIAKTY